MMRGFMKPIMTTSLLTRSAVAAILIAGSSLFNFAAVPDSSAAAPGWTADNGNGTYSNPLFYEEFEDPDVIRMGEDYYLAARPCT
jgi:hypothetical protein